MNLRKACAWCRRPFDVTQTIQCTLAFFATALTLMAVFDCSLFATSDGEALYTGGLWTAGGAYLNATNDNGSQCISWENAFTARDETFVLDASLKAAQTFGIAAVVSLFSWPFCVPMIMLYCIHVNGSRIDLILWGLMILCGNIAVLMLLMMVGMTSTHCRDANSCTIGSSGFMTLISSVLWFLTAMTFAQQIKMSKREQSVIDRINILIQESLAQPNKEEITNITSACQKGSNRW